jgi:hypothetical protein
MPTAEWATSNAIVQAAAGSQTQKQVPLLEGTYFIAFRDQSGNALSNTCWQSPQCYLRRNHVCW